MTDDQTNKSSNIFSRTYFYIAGFTLFIGLLPLVLYLFSEYYGRESEFEGMNHGPFHQFPAGDYQAAAPHGIDWILSLIFAWPSFLLFFILLCVFLLRLFTKRFKSAFSYLLLAVINFIFFIFQMGIIFWLYD